jgi:hypothetical protein
MLALFTKAGFYKSKCARSQEGDGCLRSWRWKDELGARGCGSRATTLEGGNRAPFANPRRDLELPSREPPDSQHQSQASRSPAMAAHAKVAAYQNPVIGPKHSGDLHTHSTTWAESYARPWSKGFRPRATDYEVLCT